MLADRRTFLRSLAALPLVGGSVALIGSPTAAAVPVTNALLERYSEWLATEYGETLIELAPRHQPEHPAFVSRYRRQWCVENRTINPEQESGRFAMPPILAPSTRAAVILSAAGVTL